MPEIKINRDSVHAGDDMESHLVSITVDESTIIQDLLSQALTKCSLPSIYGGKATWFVYADTEPRRYLAVVAQQWSNPKFLVQKTDSVVSVFTSFPESIIFRYWCQSDPDEVYDALANNKELPSRYT